MIQERLPAVARTITHKLNNEVEGDGCLGGRVPQPSWTTMASLEDQEQLQMGVRPPPATSSSQVSGHTDGNIARSLLLSTSSGGRWC